MCCRSSAYCGTTSSGGRQRHGSWWTGASTPKPLSSPPKPAPMRLWREHPYSGLLIRQKLLVYCASARKRRLIGGCMAVVIRLQRIGKPKQAHFRVVAIEKRHGPHGKPLEVLGSYNPRIEKAKDKLKIDSAC